MQADDPRHGTNAGYRAGCRDTCCRRAHTLYINQYRLRQLRGESTVTDPTPSVRRLRALMAFGWTARQMSAHLGWSTTETQQLSLGRRGWIAVEKAARIREMYDRLSMTRPQGWVADRQRRLIAARHSWPPPWAYDDDMLLSKDGTTGLTCADASSVSESGVTAGRIVGEVGHCDDVDEAVVVRILGGDWKLRATAVEKAEVVRRWRKAGRSLNDLERLTGWNVPRYTKEAA